MSRKWPEIINAESLAGRFEKSGPLTFGLEEEIMVLDPQTLNLLPKGAELIKGLDARFKPEMPAAQIEIALEPVTSLGALTPDLMAARRRLMAHVGDRARLLVAGVHPTADAVGQVNPSDRYDRLFAEYGEMAARQLVSGLHLHLGLGGHLAAGPGAVQRHALVFAG